MRLDDMVQKGAVRAVYRIDGETHGTSALPQSGHQSDIAECPLCAISRHGKPHSITPSARRPIEPMLDQICALSRASIIFHASATIASLGLFSSVAGHSGS
jgi:hypothetical protein